MLLLKAEIVKIDLKHCFILLTNLERMEFHYYSIKKIIEKFQLFYKFF